MPDPKVAPVADGPKEPETIGELVQSIVGEAVPQAIAEARKAWAKDLADLLDIGADTSSVNDPTSIDDPVIEPVADPVIDPAPSTLRTKKFSFL